MNADAPAAPSLHDRMPPLAAAQLDDAQRAAADELIAGPRKAVTGPFIPLLRSPELMGRLQKVGEFLRFSTCLPTRVTEFATLIVARDCTQQFEWFTHVPLALRAGTSQSTIEALRDGRRPQQMSEDEAIVHDFATELLAHRGVSDGSYAACRARFGEAGVVELTSLIGYFVLVSLVLNVAHTPPNKVDGVAELPPLPR